MIGLRLAWLATPKPATAVGLASDLAAPPGPPTTIAEGSRSVVTALRKGSCTPSLTQLSHVQMITLYTGDSI